MSESFCQKKISVFFFLRSASCNTFIRNHFIHHLVDQNSVKNIRVSENSAKSHHNIAKKGLMSKKMKERDTRGKCLI